MIFTNQDREGAPGTQASLQRPYTLPELLAGHAHENLVVKLASGVEHAAQSTFVLEAERFEQLDGSFVEGVGICCHFPIPL